MATIIFQLHHRRAMLLKALSDPLALLDSVGMTHNSTYLLQQGRLVPKGCARMNILLDVASLSDVQQSVLSAMAFKLPAPRSHDDLAQSMKDISKDQLASLQEVELPLTATLLDLKTAIRSFPALEPILTPETTLRIRDLDGLQMTRFVTDDNETLKKLKVPSSGRSFAVTLLSGPDTVDANTFLLNVCRRFPATRVNTLTRVVAFSDGQYPSVVQLTNVLSAELSLSPEDMVIAKFDKGGRKWIVLGDKTSPRKGKKIAINLREAPFLLKHGDILAVKLKSEDPKNVDDFTLPMQIQTPKTTTATDKGSDKKKVSRPEPRLAIHVPTYDPNYVDPEQ